MTGHLDPSGRLRMVDVGSKAVTKRRAVASCEVVLAPDVIASVSEGTVAKGDVLAVAQVAGVQAAKRTPELIPGCHPLSISAVQISFAMADDRVRVTAEVGGTDRTGFEMEALCAAAVAALTVYDMCKGADPHARITELRVEAKHGGTSPRAVRLDGVNAVVVTVSDRSAAGEREDSSGPRAREWLTDRGASVLDLVVVPDDRAQVARALREAVDRHAPDLIVTSGGTGVAVSDVTPEATMDVADRVVPGLAEAIRADSLRATPNAMLARGVAVTVERTLVVNLPGSPKAVVESLEAVAPVLSHAVTLLRGGQPHP